MNSSPNCFSKKTMSLYATIATDDHIKLWVSTTNYTFQPTTTKMVISVKHLTEDLPTDSSQSPHEKLKIVIMTRKHQPKKIKIDCIDAIFLVFYQMIVKLVLNFC
jgi:hypothetical protein